MNIVEKIFDTGIGATAKAVGGLAKDIRTAITGKESVTEVERMKILDLAHQVEMLTMQMDKDLMLAQVELNKIEAASDSIYKSGWRPAAGWSCVAGALWYPVLRLLLPWGIQVGAFFTGADMAKFPELPPIETEVMWVMLSAMLGIGTMRTIDKGKGKKNG